MNRMKKFILIIRNLLTIKFNDIQQNKVKEAESRIAISSIIMTISQNMQIIIYNTTYRNNNDNKTRQYSNTTVT